MYKIEAHVVDEGTEEVRMTLTFWGETQEEAQEAYDEAIESWEDFADAEDDDRVIIEQAACDDDERPVVADDEEEEEEVNPKKPA